MKKLFVNKKGSILIKDVNDPIIETKGVLVNTSYSLISSGTELAGIQTAKLRDYSIRGILKNLISSRDYRKRIFQEIKKRSIKNIFFFYKLLSQKSESKNFKSPALDLLSLGYSSSGIVVESNIELFKRGDPPPGDRLFFFVYMLSATTSRTLFSARTSWTQRVYYRIL